MGVTFKASVNAQSQYYGSVVITGFAQDGGGEVKVEKHVTVNLTLPATVSPGDVNYTLNPWVPLDFSTENDQVESAKFKVAIKAALESPYTLKSTDTLTIGVNGDLTDAVQQHLESIRISVDD
ncbi:hypothetical protein ACGFZP_27010 [Kitasatospora sp. NPDC048239]|uniref:hypothetical protein n=1 Tax=Kitasatospora sp. NPDC048239 TaxID=3364046 RepID=UPI0037154B71